MDISRDNGDPIAPRYNIIYKQSRPLLYNSHFQNVLMKLLGDKEDVEVAKVIEKTLRQRRSPTRSSSQVPESPTWSPRFRPYFTSRSQMRCFYCNAVGHFARGCPSRPLRRSSGAGTPNTQS